MKDKTNKGFWQRFARLYAPAMKSSSKLYDDICACIRPNLNCETNVLELACGTGQLSFPLSVHVRSWEATDFSEAMIAEAKKKERPSQLNFSVQDATNLPYEDERFDVVVISNALHIMPHPEKALEEIHRVLKSDGMLFAPTFVHGEKAALRLRVRLMELVGFHTFSEWNEEEFVDYLESHAFVVTEHRTLGGSLAPLCYVSAAPHHCRR